MDPAVLILKNNVILDNPMETTLRVLLAYCIIFVLIRFLKRREGLRTVTYILDKQT